MEDSEWYCVFFFEEKMEMMAAQIAELERSPGPSAVLQVVLDRPPRPRGLGPECPGHSGSDAPRARL